MSNEVYGYLEGKETSNGHMLLQSLQEKTGIGIQSIPVAELYNYPKEMLPSNEEGCVAFIIGDKPGKTNTTYLTDYMDYASDADIGFPCNGKERLKLLIDLFVTMINETCATRFIVAITDSSQIEEVKTVSFDQINSVIFRDFEEHAPPDCLYDIVLSDKKNIHQKQ